MRGWFVIVMAVMVVLGCRGIPGPERAGVVRREAVAPAVERLIAASQRGDRAAVAALLGSSVVYGGMWFADARCRTQLAQVGKLTSAGLDVLAGCVAGLKLRRSTRTSPIPEVFVLAYDPGLEIEVGFDRGDEPRIRWIGHVARDGLADALPTVLPEVLEAARTAGSRELPADPAVQAAVARELAGTRRTWARTWLKVCVDATGAVHDVRPRAMTSPAAHQLAVAAVRSWAFRPIVLGGKPAPVCSMVALDMPAASPEPARAIHAFPHPVPEQLGGALQVPASLLERNRVGERPLVVPTGDETRAIRATVHNRVHAVFQYCVDRAGTVAHVGVIRESGLPELDARIGRDLGTRRYAPFVVGESAVPVCVVHAFTYKSD